MAEPIPALASDDRLSIVELAVPEDRSDFGQDVRAGLSADPKHLDPKYFYDELGSLLFEAICALPEYYVTRAEAAILAAYAGEMVGSLEGPVRLLELGSGSSSKTRYVIEALLARQPSLVYSPIDISRSAIDGSCEGLLRAYPELSIRAFVGDYLTTFDSLPHHDRARTPETFLVLFLGSTIGNLTPAARVELLRAVRESLAPGDALLLGADRVKGEDVLVPAYDDALGVTAAFNLNLLVRINRELGGRFDLSGFRHRAVWNAELSRMEMHIVSRAAQRVELRDLGFEASFEPEEAVLSECSYKFDDASLHELAEASGFEPTRGWTDSQQLFSSSLLTAV